MTTGCLDPKKRYYINKLLLAREGAALQALAREKGAGLGIEAAVAGGIPILRALRESFAGDRVVSVGGILNGTCNFILTEMEETGRPYGDVLKDAQRHGLRVLPVDVMRSEWQCAVIPDNGLYHMRLGLNYVRGLRKICGEAIVAARRAKPFANMSDFIRRVPELSKEDIRALADIGA